MLERVESVKKGIVIIFAANILNLCISLIRNFIIPKYLPINTYADIKLYQLINSYGGLLALGYIDGIHIRYGGKKISDIDKKAFVKNLSTFRIMELTIVSIVVIIGGIKRNYIIIFSALSVLAINITGYYSSFFQATGLFSYYTKILNASSILLFVMNMILIFGVNVSDALYYIVGSLLIYMLVWWVVEFVFYKLSGIKPSFMQCSFNEARNSISTGFFLMCGLLASNFMTGMDRWFVRGFFGTTYFAMYSFAASAEGFLGYAVSPISLTMYNYFCCERDSDRIKRFKDGIVLFSAGIIGTAFGVKFILEYYLTNYKMANGVIFFLFASQLFYSIIKCLFINLYKAQKKQKEYFIKMLVAVIAGVGFNIIAYSLYKQVETFAIATLCSSFLWCLLCCIDFKEVGLGGKDFTFIIISIIVFLVCGFKFKSYIGGAIYYFFIVALSLFMYRKTMVDILSIAKKSLMKRKKC